MKELNNYSLLGISLLSTVLSSYWLLPWAAWKEEAAYHSMIEDVLDPEHRIPLDIIESRYMEHPGVIIKLADFYLSLGAENRAQSLLLKLKSHQPEYETALDLFIKHHFSANEQASSTLNQPIISSENP